MTASPIVDGIILVILLISLIGGWRLGAFASVLSTVGVLAGLIVGAGIAPIVMTLTDNFALRFLLALGTVVLLIGIGNLVGGYLGSALRERMPWGLSRLVDSLVGSLFQVGTALVVIWLVSIPLAAGVGGQMGEGIRESRILRGVDRHAPVMLSQLPAKISAMISESGLPPLVSPFQDSLVAEVEAPRIEVEDHDLVERLRPSVIHVLGDAHSCRRRLLGSGFVSAPDYVITNAHVVAGTDDVRLDTTAGMKQAEVVYYNPNVDIAVLHSPDLGLPMLPWAQEEAQAGQDAIVMGFPQSGPFEAAPARVSGRLRIAGPDIYAAGRVEREAYTARGNIRQGNSGGPMINTQGEVIGVVFGASLDDSDTGYALTAAEVLGQVGDVTLLHTPVDTQSCVAK